MAFPRVSLKHSASRLLALFFALLVYAHVYTEQERTADFTLPVRVQGMAQNLELLSEPPRDVRLTLRGTGKQLVKLRVRPPEVVLDLSEARPGEVQRIISPADVLLPASAGVTVEAIHAPKAVTLQVDSLITRRLPVEIALIGRLERGLSLQGALRPEPQEVLVQGPSTLVQPLEALTTEPLDLSRIQSSVTRELSVRHDSTLTVHPQIVAVTLELIPTQAKTLVLTVEARGATGRTVRILPETATLHVEGPVEILEGAEVGTVDLWVDVADLPLGLHRLSPQVSLPFENIEVIAVVPSEFLVDVGG